MFYALDPATGERKKRTQKKQLSKSARLVAARDNHTGTLYVIQAIMDRRSPSKIIWEMYDLHDQHNFLRMGYEKNLFRELFEEHISAIKKSWEDKNRVELRLPHYGIWNRLKKEQRIYSVEPFVSSGQVLINEHINPEFLAQLKSYPNTDQRRSFSPL